MKTIMISNGEIFMVRVLFTGFLLGIAYVAPLGMQNVYLINNSMNLAKGKAYIAALIIAFYDITLAFACYFGIGLLMVEFEVLRLVILILGCLAMYFIGTKIILSKKEVDYGIYQKQTLVGIMLTSMVVTWFNPQALIDGSLILGSFRTSYNSLESMYFIFGVSIASLTWFLTITTIVSSLKKVIKGKIIRTINIICGVILIVFATRFALEVIHIIF